LVVGDVNSTVACGLVAVKLGVKLIHVEAGLRSFDRQMPEEINRLLTDAISDFMFCTEKSAMINLIREGANRDRIFLVGNLMIDTLLKNRERAEASPILERLGINGARYAVLTLHRPSNVDNEELLDGILAAVEVIQKEMPVVFPIHPRTRRIIEETRLGERVARMENLRLIEPASYLDFLKLLARARVVLTDSGGIQEETTILHVPCLTLRENTERPVTVQMGTNRIVGTQSASIIEAYRQATRRKSRSFKTPPLWDGDAAARITMILSNLL
jgi:UDP-N-acetylglucosamine 2-epimerase (non-hydrolysing)